MYDLIVIGGGPAGLSACIYAGRGLLNTLLLEKQTFGGRIKDTELIRNYPGIEDITGDDLAHLFLKHAENTELIERMRGTVSKLEVMDDYFRVHTLRRGIYEAKTVILAMGTRERILGIPGEAQFSGFGVSYCATCDAELVKDKDVYIVGSGNVALESADFIAKFANSTTIISVHDTGIVDGDASTFKRLLNNPKIDFIYNAKVRSINGDEHVSSITIEVPDGVHTMDCEGVFMYVGSTPETEFLKDMGILNDQGYIEVDERMRTKIAGLYAAGDCTTTTLRQVIVAAADGAKAAVFAERYLRGDRR
ncbi:FAD-dependent oxidoreductase [Peptoniphilus equinus]|uniref:FAD-dependent oxidoreductase n=1 Tax=Peptoniphilus equinus TaxID=3016343 RepID=A0ABY7QWE7_9FIRM|nr:FAD-dependent oxidoreductase [Peptoniphilus equinus]WBW50543.1 FAD-dependent oxidoreductase [Peptoniphilus equinus]